MKNFISDGVTAPFAQAFAVTGGAAYKIGDIVAVAMRDGAANEKLPYRLMGTLKMPKVLAQAMTPGQAVYWDDTAKKLTTSAAGNKKFGFTVEAAGAGDPDVIAYLYALS